MTSSSEPPSKASDSEPNPDSGASRPLRQLWRIKSYCYPYRYRFVGLWSIALVSIVLASVIPRLIGFAIDGPIASGDGEGLLRWGALLLAVGILEAVTVWGRRHLQTITAMAVEADMRSAVYHKLQTLHTGFHDRHMGGQLLSRATTDLAMVRRFFAGGLVFFLHGVLMTLFVFVQLFLIDWRLALFSAVSLVPVYLAGRRFFRDYIPKARQLQNKLGDIASAAEESAQGLRAIKAMGRGPHMAGRFDREVEEARRIALSKEDVAARSWSVFDGVGTAAVGFVLVVGVLLVTRGEMTVGELTAYMLLQMMLLWPMEALGWVLAHLNEAATASDRVYDILDAEPAITQPESPVVLQRPRGRLVFENVGFTYPENPRAILRDVDLELRPGETLALAGKTGSGKTTLAHLPSRLADPTAGRVTLDGTDVRDLDLTQLRSVVATAFEEPTLFSMSVRENLALGRPDASDEDVREALRVAQAEFVLDLPYGLDTRVGEQGLSLSGGQRQRLALARAVLVRPTVLILDDPLSALDVHTEELVERALATVLTETTALVVVHRPSTVALADRVALLDGGTIAAVGTHAELMATCPRYVDVLSAGDAEDEREEVSA
ncbi:ABC transporter ATP-binding protein [Salininema proteolyticum]|uniref:ABC transporter ATP-binding protein n=1 Tax=Salininema proteolyticum TaxID=1607685 RepID=A0ABV8TVK8_9ACTN